MAIAKEPKAPGPGPAPAAGPLLDDAAKIRAAAGRRPAAPRSRRPPAEAPAPPEAPAVDPEAAKFWGRQYAAFWNQLAAPRGWPQMPGAPVDQTTGVVKASGDPAVFAQQIGEPVARTMERALPAIDQRPWLQVALLSLPFALGAVVIEGQRLGRYIRDRRNVAAGRPPGRAGADGAGQDRVRPGLAADDGLTPGISSSGDR